MDTSSKHLQDLYELFASVESADEAELLLRDLLTPQELESVCERWQLVQGLASGMPQRDVAKQLGVSISKITRGSRSLQFGNGGFKHFLQKIQKTKTM